MWRLLSAGLLLCAAEVSTAQTANSTTLNSVRSRGAVTCGVNDNLEGFAKANSLGEYSGFDIDLCRAVSAAVFADPDKARFISTTPSNRFRDLLDRKFDILIRNTTWTLSRDASLGDFAGINYYDGQGFMVWKLSGARNALELDNISLCVQSDSNAQTNAENYFSVNNLRYKPSLFNTVGEAIAAYTARECDALTTDQSTLAALLPKQKTPDAHRILSSVVSKEPLGPMVRSNDTGWANVVRWSLYCMINAEELGVTQENVGSISETDTVDIQRLAGVIGDYGTQLGLNNSWCADIIRTVGNYGESYQRHLGSSSEINLPRGINNLWTNGGLIFAPPIR